MNLMHRVLVGLATLIFSAHVAATGEKTGKSQKQGEPQRPLAAPADPPARTITYVPPRRGAPSTRVGGASRSSQGMTSIEVLAPQHTGYTLREQPDLYWYLSHPVNSAVELTVIDEDEQAGQPLLVVSLAPSAEAGIHRVRLADHGVRLKPGGVYRWSVALVPDPEQRSHDLIASGTIRRTEPPQQLALELAGAERQVLPFRYAEEGLWYDAIAAVSELMENLPTDPRFRKLRASLLEQVELPEVAAHDRSK